MTWTEFWDMYSGGQSKLQWEEIYIEAPEEEARTIFENRFKIDPDNTTCECCGPDYVVEESPTLKQASGRHRDAPCTETKRDPKTGLYLNSDPLACLYLDKGEKPPKGYKIDTRFSKEDFSSLEEYVKRDDVLVIYKKDIKESERR